MLIYMKKKICCKILKCFDNLDNIICFMKKNRCKKGEVSFIQLQNIYCIDNDIISNITIYLQNSYNDNDKIIYNFKFGSYCKASCKTKLNLYNCMYGYQATCINLSCTFDCIDFNCFYNCDNSNCNDSSSNSDSSSDSISTSHSYNSCNSCKR